MDDVNPDYCRDQKEFNVIPYIVDTLERSRARRAADAKRVSELYAGVEVAEKEAYEEDLHKVNEEVGAIVEANYRGFNESVQSFSRIFQEFTEAQTKVRRLKEYVEKSKETLVSRKRNLKNLWFQKLQQVKAIELMREMETVASAPERIDTLLAEEKFVECVETFQTAWESAYGPSLGTITALGQVRLELLEYREKIHATLIDALLGYLSGLRDPSKENDVFAEPDDTSLLANSTSMKRRAGGQGRKGADQELSKGAVLSLDSIVKALHRLGRLKDALHKVKSNLREQLDDVIQRHMSSARKFKTPIGLSVSLYTVDDVRLQNLFREVLRDLKGIFNRHVQFSLILRSEDAEVASLDYSIQETWSTIQVEVQQLLELHLASTSSSVAASSMDAVNGVLAANQPANAAGPGSADGVLGGAEDPFAVQFRCDQARSVTLDRTRATHTGAASGVGVGGPGLAGAQQLPICSPSSYRVLGLVNPVVEFANYGDGITGMGVRPQLLGYVRDFCSNTLTPQLQLDGLNSLEGSFKGDFAFEPYVASAAGAAAAEAEFWVCRTNLGTTLCKELVRLSDCVRSLAVIDCSFGSVLADLLVFFIEYCQSEVTRIMDGKLCKAWVETNLGILREDPNYLAIIAAASDSASAPKPGRLPRKEAAAARAVRRRTIQDHIRNEREAEAKVARAVLPSQRQDLGNGGSTSPSQGMGSSQGLLTTGQMSRLASIHSTCDLIFRSLALRNADSITDANQVPDRALSPSAKKQFDLGDENKRDLADADAAMGSRGAQLLAGTMSPIFVDAMREEAMVALLDSPKIRNLLAKLDNIAERCIFALRCELRIRCISGLASLPGELATATTKEEGKAADLIRSARCLENTMSRAHRSYVMRALCVLLAELVLESLRSFARQLLEEPVDGPKARGLSFGLSRRGSSKAAADASTPPPVKFSQHVHLGFLNQAVSVFQQTMWTILLHSVGAGVDDESQDQLEAFVGVRRFLHALESPRSADDVDQVLQQTSAALFASLSAADLADLRDLVRRNVAA
ncbi:Exocyst complex component SEC8 (AtSec8) (Exocyst complex component 4) [Durusdinium trenchii]|uniref:Exocyst complex component Sec8 n=1 Tax=Durusdinium trenchii TaxID=1381693 RepID=A0ABP0IAT5_9DINO